MEFNYKKEKILFNLENGVLTFRGDVYEPLDENYFKYLLYYRYLILFIDCWLEPCYSFDHSERDDGYNIDLNLIKEVQDIKLIYNFLNE